MTDDARLTRSTARVLAVCVAWFLVWVIYGQLSPGTFNDDDVAHYFMAKQSIHDPSKLISLWGRPLFTLLYALPSQLGYWGVEMTTALISAATLFVTWGVAGALGLRSCRLPVAVAVAAQPFAFKLGYSGLVEPLAALLLTSALWSLLTRRARLTAFVIGLVPLTRLELVLVLPWLLVPLGRRHGLRPLPLVALGVMVWNVGGWIADGEPLWLLGQLTRNEFGRSFAGGQPLVHHLRTLPMVTGGALYAFVLAGLVRARDADPGDADPARISPRTGRTIVAGVVVTLVAGLSLLAWNAHDLGGSVGYLRHVVAVGPFIALLAGFAWEPLEPDRRGLGTQVDRAAVAVALVHTLLLALLGVHQLVWEHPVNRAVEPWIWFVGAAASAVTLATARAPSRRAWTVVAILVVTTAIAEPPIALNPERRAVADVVRFVDANGRGRQVAVNHPWFFFLSDRDPLARDRYPAVTIESIGRLPIGSLIVWDSHFGHRLQGDVPAEYFARFPERYRPVAKDMPLPTFWYVIFEVIGNARAEPDPGR